MTKWLAFLLFPLVALGQQQNYNQIPDCSLGYCAGTGAPTFACFAGQRYARIDTPGNNYTCTGSPAHWVADAGNGISLTTTGTTGAATLAGPVLNIPIYQGALSVTTTGTSGAATLSGNVLNIPQYAGSPMVFPSGTGIAVVTSGAAWGTTLTPPAGTIVGTTDTQTLTNKTVDSVTPTTFGFLDPTSSVQTQLNGKQATMSLTTTGTSGAATLIGSVLNIPQYASTAPSGTGGFLPVWSGSGPSSTFSVSNLDDGATTPGIITSTEPITVNDGSGIGGGITGTQGAARTGTSTTDVQWADAAASRWKMNNANAGNLFFVGLATAGAPGNCPQFAANGIDIVDSGGTCGTGGSSPSVTSVLFQGSTSGTVTVQAQSIAGNPTITWPTVTGQVALTTAEVVAFSATPTFTPGDSMSRMVLTGNVTSFTLGAVASGLPHVLCFEQDGTGGHTVTAPSNVHGFTAVGTTANKWSCQAFMYDAADSIWLATSAGATNQ